MDRFDEMRIFIRIMERGSFTLAAEDVQLPRATVTNAIQRLEARLGARLLERTTRTVKPTLDGVAHYQRCLRLLADMEEAEGAFRGAAPAGLLRVNLQGTLAKVIVMPALPAFLERYPDIELQIGEGDRLVDLVREGVDCVLRGGEPQDSTMVARRVAMLEQVTVASPAYLARYGRPRALDELDGHHAVHYAGGTPQRVFPLEFMVDGVLQLRQLPARLTVTGADMYSGAGLAGLGLVQVPRYNIERHLASGALQVVLADRPPPPLPVSVLYPHNRQLSARVRAFADWLRELFATALP